MTAAAPGIGPRVPDRPFAMRQLSAPPRRSQFL